MDPSGQLTKLQSLFDLSHPFQIYVEHYWVFHVQGLQDGEHKLLTSLLKTFLGSPEESSPQYRKWFSHIEDNSRLSKTIFNKSRLIKPEIAPQNVALFAMCRFAFATVLRDWWDSAGLKVLHVNKCDHNLLTLAAMAGCTPICKILIKRGIDVNSRVPNAMTYCCALVGAAGEGKIETLST